MQVFEVLLSHPSDLTPEEHKAICQALTDYNTQLGKGSGYYLIHFFGKNAYSLDLNPILKK